MDGLYDRDILLWSEQQADLLRRLAAGERVNDAVDWTNLIDEVESVGRSELHAVESLIEIALRHLMLACATPQPEPVQHWLAEALAALQGARKRFTPGMGQRISLADAWEDARRYADRKLAAMGGAIRPLPPACPYTLWELLAPEANVDVLLARLTAPASPP
ncbi:DUF29 domain-containing protein [Belnapia sp. T6]|uniref:DUF29 domain-containing protein n=1 Tax=Belnapia mucosa TaxID=2804532 RepID=A0ABS1V223_9PROT|nr:DUF29 domain-containing protein [Belnapia mucosa]MBL6455747.1 DUF29 domain-containing protein [Belnapia mucosa]